MLHLLPQIEVLALLTAPELALVEMIADTATMRRVVMLLSILADPTEITHAAMSAISTSKETALVVPSADLLTMMLPLLPQEELPVFATNSKKETALVVMAADSLTLARIHLCTLPQQEQAAEALELAVPSLQAPAPEAVIADFLTTALLLLLDAVVVLEVLASSSLLAPAPEEAIADSPTIRVSAYDYDRKSVFRRIVY